MKKKVKALFQFKNHIQTQPEIPNYLAEVDLPQAHPMDSADTLRLKASIILESFFKDSTIPRDQYTWLDIASTKPRSRGPLRGYSNSRWPQSAARPVAKSG